jgi:Fic family protein
MGWAFVPNDLPPSLDFFDLEIASAAERAAIALGNLNGSGRMLRNPTLLLRPFIRREALASSRIEGTRAEFDQLILFEASNPAGHQDPDLQEVTNYLQTVQSGWQRPPERPLSTGFLMELHQQLLSGVRGSTKGPGKLRPHQVVIGRSGDDLLTARFVPPPPEEVRELLDRLCRYIVAPSQLPALVRLSRIH